MPRIVTIACLLACLSASMFGQFGSNTARRINSGTAAPPATCNANPVDVYARSGGVSAGLYLCLTTNTWTGPLATSSGSGTVNANNGSAGAGVFYPAAAGSTTVGPLSGLTYDSVGDATLAQGTITTSNPFYQHTVTWNAGGVAFTNWLSNITCTAAATGSIAAGFGTAGTQWQFKYGAANCASPQLLSPSGAPSTLPAYSFASGTSTGVSFSSNNGGSLLLTGGGFLGASVSNSNGFSIPSSGGVVFVSGADLSAAVTVDTALTRTAAGVVSVGTALANSLGTLKAGLYATGTNCAAVGTAANPSVASCTAAAAGSFSCATNASTGTCTVNTTAVTANSEIFIVGRNDTTTGTRLSVTCNTGITTALPEISAVVAATSFTINLGTFTTNPECFSYFIVN